MHVVIVTLSAVLVFCAAPCLGRDNPVIGILTVPTFRQWAGEPTPDRSVLGPWAQQYDCFIPAGYVKLVESGMARVSLLPCTGAWQDFVSAVASVNGFVFTGMFTDFQADDRAITEYGRRGQHIIKHVFEQNQRGVWLPLFAECKGFNMLTYFVSGVPFWKDLIRDDIQATNWPAPIKFNNALDYRKTKFYAAADSTNSTSVLTSGRNLMNRHPYGVLISNYTSNANLTRVFGPYVATTIDANGVEFISVIEHPLYPIYGVASHPEKVLFEWRSTGIATPHTDASLQANLWFGKLISTDARRNNRTFATLGAEQAALVYKNQIVDFSDYTGGEFRQAYFLVPTTAPADNPTQASTAPGATISLSATAFGLVMGAVFLAGVLVALPVFYFCIQHVHWFRRKCNVLRPDDSSQTLD